MAESQLSHHQYQEIEDLFDKWKEDEEDTISITDEIYHTAEDTEPDEKQMKSPADADEKEANNEYVDYSNSITNDSELDHEKKLEGMEQFPHSGGDVDDSREADDVLLVDLSGSPLIENKNDIDDLHCNKQPVYGNESDQLTTDLRDIINRSFADISNTKEWMKQYKRQHGFSGSLSAAKNLSHTQDTVEKEQPESIIASLCEKFNKNDLS